MKFPCLKSFSYDLHMQTPLESPLDLAVSSSVFVDRITLSPSSRWMTFLMDTGKLSLHRPETAMRINTTGGPGRLVGRHTLRKFGLTILISVYELFNDSDAFSLRILLYEPTAGQTVEYQLSPMERLSIFHGDSGLLVQIIDRLRISFCRYDPHTIAIKLAEVFRLFFFFFFFIFLVFFFKLKLQL